MNLRKWSKVSVVLFIGFLSVPSSWLHPCRLFNSRSFRLNLKPATLLYLLWLSLQLSVTITTKLRQQSSLCRGQQLNNSTFSGSNLPGTSKGLQTSTSSRCNEGSPQISSSLCGRKCGRKCGSQHVVMLCKSVGKTKFYEVPEEIEVPKKLRMRILGLLWAWRKYLQNQWQRSSSLTDTIPNMFFLSPLRPSLGLLPKMGRHTITFKTSSFMSFFIAFIIVHQI